MNRLRHFRPLLTVGTLLLFFSVAGAQENSTANDLGKARELLDKWVETQQVLSKERQEWALGKETLQQRIGLLDGEIGDFDGKIGETREGIADTNTKKAELLAEKREFESAQTSLNTTITRLEGKTQALLKTLPSPVADKVQPLAQRIPSNPATAGMTLGQRYQNVIGILNELNKFNNDITQLQETIELSGGSRQVNTLYIGLGAGYYVAEDGALAGIGRSTPNGWEWVEANEMAESIARAIRVLNNEEAPAYVPLPVEIH